MLMERVVTALAISQLGARALLHENTRSLERTQVLVERSLVCRGQRTCSLADLSRKTYKAGQVRRRPHRDASACENNQFASASSSLELRWYRDRLRKLHIESNLCGLWRGTKVVVHYRSGAGQSRLASDQSFGYGDSTVDDARRGGGST